MKYPMDDPVRYNVYLPRALLHRLRRKAYFRSLPTSELMRQACLKYLDALDRAEADKNKPA